MTEPGETRGLPRNDWLRLFVRRLLFVCAPCAFAAVVFAVYCFTLGKESRAYFVHQGPQERYGLPLVIDEGGYVTIADNIALGHGYRMGWPDGYRTARRAPVFPLILAALFKLLGPHGWLGLTLNGVLLVSAIF
jgi:hypothetical protein